jgi:hypothetical protein
LRASAENFLMSTKAALQYYYEQEYHEIYDSIYLVGDEHLSPVEPFSIGASTQRNDPHFIEMYASLAACHFYGPEKNQLCWMIGRSDSNAVTWHDVPDADNKDRAHEQLGQLMRFAVAYLSLYYPTLQLLQKEGGSYRAPWVVNLLERKGGSLKDKVTQDELKAVHDYCEMLLRWIRSVHESAPGQAVELFEVNSFTPVSNAATAFDALVVKGGDNLRAVTQMWERVCGARSKDPNASGAGAIVSALFDRCALPSARRKESHGQG